MRSSHLIAAFALMVTQPVDATAQSTGSAPVRLSPAQAVMNAAEMPSGVGGVFEMVVRATGRQGSFLYLHSEADYRDPRNLTITIGPLQERALAERLGQPVEESVLRKVIAVRGIAKKLESISRRTDVQPESTIIKRTLSLRLPVILQSRANIQSPEYAQA